MKTLQKLSSLFEKLDKAENQINKYQSSLVVAPFRAIKKALERTLIIKQLLEQEIIKVADLVSKEVELQKLEAEQNKILKEISLGANVNFNYLYSLDEKIKQLKDEIN